MPQPTSDALPLAALDAIAAGAHHNPHTVLGAHPSAHGITIRVLRPLADRVDIVTATQRYSARHEHNGIWAVTIPGENIPDYRIEATYDDDSGSSTVDRTDDPYRFLPSIGELDLHLIGEGRHEQLWQVLGAHTRTYPSELGEVHGVAFTVWAPNAQAVQVIGDFNHWTGVAHSMRSLGSSGIWELFIPDVEVGTRYKFKIHGPDGAWRDKADPMAQATEVPPATASIITDSTHTWEDSQWMTRRAQLDPHTQAMTVYEVHAGSWRSNLNYREFAHELANYVEELGFTHVELMPVAEHPYGPSWGYQVTSYYAPTSRFGSPDDFRYFVDYLHQRGIGVLLDWVPAHFPKDSWALAQFDGTPTYEHPNPQRGEHPDWGTLIFDFGRNEVRNFLVANALYWLEEFHIDGLRVDAVASMLYLDYSREDGEWSTNVHGGRENLEALTFMKEMNATVYRRAPGAVTIAEESTAWPGVTTPTEDGGLGFGLKWNMGWMNDTLRYLANDPVHRQYHHSDITFSIVYAFSENFVLPLSHDEVVHGKGSLLRKMPGDRWQQMANVRALLAYQWSHPGKKLLFMGSEFAQEAEWSEARSLDWWLLDQPAHAGMQRLITDLNTTLRKYPALWQADHIPEGFVWIAGDDAENNVVAFARRSLDGQPVVVVVNFSPIPHHDYRIGLPQEGYWRELLNTDAEIYGGSGVGNLGQVVTEEVSWHGYDRSARLQVPPLGALWLAPQTE